MPYDDPEDPAHSAISPEPRDPTHPIHVVGIGPGDLSYLTPRGKDVISQADVVFGFENAVERIGTHVTGDVLTCTYGNQDTQLETFARRTEDGDAGVVIMTGDPNVSDYQMLGRIETAVDRPVRVIPGISSVQIAASRARMPLEETTFVTLHKRGSIDSDLERLRMDIDRRHLLVLPRPWDWMPERIARLLVEDGVEDREVIVFEHLTHPEEDRVHTRLTALAEQDSGKTAEQTQFSDLSIMAIPKERAWTG